MKWDKSVDFYYLDYDLDESYQYYLYENGIILVTHPLSKTRVWEMMKNITELIKKLPRN